MNILTIDNTSSEQRLLLAAEFLDRCKGAVVLDGVATLRPHAAAIECEVAAPADTVARCEEEFKVLVENAARALQASRLGQLLPERPLRWIVVDNHGGDRTELWRAAG
jgi:hypothetical protein